MLKKSTLNFLINNVELKFRDGKIKSEMKSGNDSSISILNVNNNVLNTNDDIDFYFSEPSTNVVPYLNLFDAEEVEIELFDNKIVLKDGNQKSILNFCSPTIITKFGTNSVRSDVDWFYNEKINSEFVESFNKIKKIGSKFQKIYFEIKDKEFFIETSDKSNEFSNGLKFKIMNIDYDNLILSFDYKDVVNIMTVINGEFENFFMKFAYKKEQEMGMMYVESVDESEKYCLLSTEI